MEKNVWLKIWGLVLVYTCLFSALDLLRHFSYTQNSNDVAAFDQSLWYFIHGNGFYNSIEAMNHLGVHASPILVLLAPLYALFPSPVTLIISQCLACALGIPLVFLIAKQVINEKAGLAFAVLFALYHPLHGVSWDILNELCYVIPPLFLLFYGFLARNSLLLWMGALLSLLCKEEIGFIVGFFGIFLSLYGLREQRKKIIFHGIGLMIVGFGWTFWALSVLIPHFRGGPYRYFTVEDRYLDFGQSIGTILYHIITHPFHVIKTILTRQKIFYCLELVAPLAFVPLAAPLFLLIPMPTLLANLLSNAAMMSMVGARYPAALIPFIFIAGIYGTKKMVERAVHPEGALRKILRIQLVCTLLCTLLFSSTPLRLGFRIPKITKHSQFVSQVLKTIPSGSVVSTQPNFTAHVPHGCVVSPFFRNDADFVVLDSTFSQGYRDSGMIPDQVLEAGYRMKIDVDGILLFTRNTKGNNF